MQIAGIMHGKELVGMRVEFTCKQCGETERITLSSALARDVFLFREKLANEKICLNCYTDSKVPAVAESLEQYKQFVNRCERG